MRRIEFTIPTQNYRYDGKAGDRIPLGPAMRFGRMGGRLLKVLSLICLLLITIRGNDAIAQCALVCNDDVNISLPGTNSNCEVEVTVDMVLEDPQSCNAPLEVTILNLQGFPIPTSPVVNETHIGQTFIYSVEETNSGNSCWGTIEVEDKLGPNQDGCVDLFVPCIVDYKPTIDGGDVATPLFTDCSGVQSLNYSDVISTYNCTGTSPSLTAIVVRTWTAVDNRGNVSECTQNINVERVSLLDYTPECPPNVTLECDSAMPSTDPADTGYPTIEINGQDYNVVPGADDFCEIAASYSDEVFDICGGGLKILRTWNVYDWCLDTDPTIPNPFTCIQVIKIEDKTAPSIVCPGPIVHNAATNGCSASLTLPPALVSDVCSGWSVKILTPFGVVSGNGGLLLNVPVGTHNITYVATDDCGNINSCPTTLTIEDNSPPTAICDEHTTISLTADGTAIAAAMVFDDGSTDNCDIDDFLVKRMDNNLPFAEFAEFYCDDIGDDIMVILRVYDSAGNHNECMIEVEVQDKLPPSIICPANKTAECSQPLPPETPPTVQDNCPNPTVTMTEVSNINTCGTGTVTRIYTATDMGGLTSTCQQVITVVNSFPFGLSNIDWPDDYTSSVCGVSLEPEDLPLGFDRPLIDEDACDMVAVTYTDQELPINPPACYKVLRKWIVIDWCQYDPNDPSNGGYWERTQVLKVEDQEAPVLDCPDNVTVLGDDANCLAEFVDLDPVVATDCSENFNFEIRVDLFSDSSIDYVVNGPDASGSFPFGEHNLIVRVEDRCGNISECYTAVIVEDAKRPSPICVNGLAVELMPDNVNGGGMIQLTPQMFDQGSFDNCTDPADLTFDLTPSFFNCDDVGTNVVYLYVTDEAGNTDFCETYVIIQDNMVICPDPLTADISGNIATHTGQGLVDVSVNVSGNGPLTQPITTDQNGHFQFFDLNLGYDYTFTPVHDNGHLNGVTTYDMVVITRHVLNIQLLDSPYKIIAADVNNSGSVTTSDVVELRRLILQILPDFTNNTSWRFIESDHVFQNPQNPFVPVFPEVYNVNNLASDQVGVDFVAVKIGDVNGSASTHFAGNAGDDRSFTGELTFVVDDQKVRAGETFRVAFTANNFINLFGYQFAMHFDPEAAELEDVEIGDLTNLTKANFGYTMLDEGIITTSWDNSKNILHDNNTILFTLVFKANTNTSVSDLIRITNTIPAEAYQQSDGNDINMLDIGLAFNNRSEESGKFELYQNNPNPFAESTKIGFRLPEAGKATLTVYDLSGKILTVVTEDFEAGYNEIVVTRDQLGTAGILFYQLETPSHTATKRMVRL